MFKELWNCLSWQSDLWVKEWNETSLIRRHLRYSRSDRFLRNAGERTAAFLLDVVGTALLISFLAWFIFHICLASPVPTLVANDSAMLSYFGALWSIQATLAALVYPIVISFVAVLLRRRATATLGLRIYSLDTGVLPSGSSSIALVGWMALQYLAMPFLDASVMAAAMIGNLTWFLLNMFLTSRFLHRTIRFMNDEDRMEVFKQFAVHVAFPRDLHSYLMGNILQTAQERGLLPGKPYAGDGDGPKILLYPMAVGSSCVELNVRRQRQVVDIRLRVLHWAISLWLWSVRKDMPAPSIAGLAAEHPALQLAVYPGQLIEGRATIWRTTAARKPNWIVGFLLRLSIVLGPPSGRDTSYSTSDILEEISIETLELIEQRRYEAASGTLRTLTEVHDTLIRSGAFTNTVGVHDNAALMQDPYGFATRRLHELWLDSYNELAQLAVNVLTSSSTPFQHHCYLTQRLAISLRNEHTDILIQLLHIPGYLMFRLGSWWSEKVEERGSLKHDHVHGAAIPYPLGRVYERAIESFIGSWEQLELWESADERERSRAVWVAQSHRGRFAAKHLERTLYFLLDAVSRGDTTASVWFADSLLKWWGARRHRFGEADQYNFRNPYLNAAWLTKDWSTITSQISGMPDGDGAINAADLVATALHRYWIDIRMLGVLILLHWLSGDAPQSALSSKIAMALLDGRALKAGGDTDRTPIGVEVMVAHLLRMQLVDGSYTGMLDRVVAEARELRRERMVSGRMYGSSGADDVESLASSQALLLASVVSPRMRFPSIENFEALWSGNLRKSEHAERWARHLRTAFEEDSYRQKRAIAQALRDGIRSAGTLEEVEGRLTRTLTRMADRIRNRRNQLVAAAQISQQRLDDLAKEISDYILSASNGVFPFVLNPSLKARSNLAGTSSVIFQGVGKSPYTDPQLEPRSTSESSSYSTILASRIGGEVTSSRLRSKNIAALRTDSESNFLTDVRASSDTLRAQGLTPLLLLPQYDTPECARPWRYIRRERAGEAKALVRVRGPSDARGVTSLFLGVPAYDVPWSSECFVVAREWFNELSYSRFMDTSCIGVSATTQPSDTMSVRFEWMFLAS